MVKYSYFFLTFTSEYERGNTRLWSLRQTEGYLLSESEQENVLKDPDMLKRLNEIEKMDDTDKGQILSVIDGFIKSIKLKNIAAL